MFLSAWVLFYTLAIANLQRVAILEDTPDILPEKCNGLLINENFVNTTVVLGSPVLEYCIIEETKNFTNSTGTSENVTETIDLDLVIEIYKKLNFTNLYEHVTPNSPITESGVLSINDHQELPLFLKADIKHRHIRINPDAAPGPEADEQMALMGQLTTDDRVCLLPRSIGGVRGINVVPMARRVHRLPKSRRTKDDGGELKPTTSSSWKSGADWILKFLQTYPNGRVELSVAVQYANNTVADPLRHRAYRPVGFARQFSAYMNQSEESLFYKSPQTTLLNNNDDPCGPRAIQNFTDRIRPVPSECRLSNTTYMNSSRGIGKEKSKNVWAKPYIVSFPFTIEGQTFFYGQCVMEGRQWFIQELLRNGKIGEKISRGKRNFYYKTAFSYSIRGKHFLFSHRGSGGTYWFIQELLPDGQMGAKMSDGNWGNAHNVGIPYNFTRKHYFYGQIESINRWNIRELLPNGEMGNITSHGYNIKSVVFVHTLNNQRNDRSQYLYSHDPLLLTWQIQELLKNGKMGEILSEGNWTEAHHTSVPYSIDKQHFFFGQNLHSGYWFVQEIFLNGTMGEKIAEGEWKEPYEVVFAYVVKERHFMYGHNQRTKAWVIRELL